MPRYESEKYEFSDAEKRDLFQDQAVLSVVCIRHSVTFSGTGVCSERNRGVKQAAAGFEIYPARRGSGASVLADLPAINSAAIISKKGFLLSGISFLGNSYHIERLLSKTVFHKGK